MLGIGWTEFIVIALVLLIFVGPKNLPVALGKISSLMNQFKQASRDLRIQLDAELADVRAEADSFTKEMMENAEAAYKAAESVEDDVRALSNNVQMELGEGLDQLEEEAKSTPKAAGTPSAELGAKEGTNAGRDQ